MRCTSSELARPAAYAAPAFLSGSLARWFDDVFDGTVADRSWAPSLDVSETEHAFFVTAELPGLAKADVSIQLENDVLTVSGEKKASAATEGVEWHRVERRYGAFHRAVTLPRGAAAELAKATFENGLLTIEIPKRDEVKPRSIQIA